MRSQKEIQDKIEELRRTQSDPMRVQRKHLIRKLTWENAKSFLSAEALADDVFKEKWKQGSRLDRELLIKEINDFMLGAYSYYIDGDAIKCLVAGQYILVWVWLLGNQEERFFRYLLVMFERDHNHLYRHLFDETCRHFGWKVEKFMRSFEDPLQKRVWTPPEESAGGIIL